MVGISSTDEFIIRDIHLIIIGFDGFGHTIDIRLGIDTLLLGFFFDLLTVFICSGHKADIVAFFAFETGYGIGQNDFIGIADVGFAGCIGNGGSDVIGFLGHGLTPFYRLVESYKNVPERCSGTIE